MKKYAVKVNGISYDVEIEEVRTRPSYRSASPASRVPRQSVSMESSPLKAAPEAVPVNTPASAEGANVVNAPMPGTIVAVKVTAGQTVKSGETLMVLEAMKMENEIVCPRDGTVSAIRCAQGDYVTTGAVLCEIV